MKTGIAPGFDVEVNSHGDCFSVARNIDNDRTGLTRRQLLGMAALTRAGLAAASMGVPKAQAATERNAELLSADGLPPLEDFTYDLEGSAEIPGRPTREPKPRNSVKVRWAS